MALFLFAWNEFDVLRFRSDTSDCVRDSRSRRFSRQRWRLWMLLIALGLVIATMRQLNQPGTARRLEQVFSAGETSTQRPSGDSFVLSDGKPSEKPSFSLPSRKELREPSAASGLGKVEDNTYFRPAENDAWFELLGRLQQTDSEQLLKETLGELTYAQLLKQPEVYRGRVVTIGGTLRREEVVRPQPNKLGVEAYHRLIIQPRGGGHWPFVVYCLELPVGFPRGEGLQVPLSVTGFFFKNWSYAWEEGLGTAPVVLARSVDWQPAVRPSPDRTWTRSDFAWGLVAAGIFAMLVVRQILRNTRRPSHLDRTDEVLVLPDEETPVETVHEQLQRLAERGGDA